MPGGAPAVLCHVGPVERIPDALVQLSKSTVSVSAAAKVWQVRT
ncbi:hypothetical protein QFZ76_009236 [Streptomyces sp. V4I2]|nr:hypothetical protein [Streptomyces sp. V4I2]